MDLTSVSATNVGRRKFIAFFEDLSYKIEKTARRTFIALFETPVALRGPRIPNGEDLSYKIEKKYKKHQISDRVF